MNRISCLVLLAALSGTAVAEDCAFEAKRDLALPAGGVKTLKLQTRAGDLRIVGSPGLATVELHGRACASSQAQLDALQLQHSRSGDRLDVFTTTPEEATFKLFSDNYAYIDLEVRLPQELALDLDDSSGDIEIRDAGAIEMRDSSGDIKIYNPRGDVSIRDTSGDIHVEQARGSVTVVADSSGDIEIDGAARDVAVEEDSSGDIEIAHVSGNARVGHDSSGDIRFRDIGGNAEVGTDSSGSIHARGIRGDFRVGEKSGGTRNIDYADVGGRVSLPDHD